MSIGKVSGKCAACGKPYIFHFDRRWTPEKAYRWLTSCGWIIVGPPVRFYCGESCQIEAARDVTARAPALPAPGAAA